MFEPTPEFVTACERLDLAVTPEQLARLQRFLELLHEANRQFNLTAVKDPHVSWMRHVLDSLSLLPFLGEAQTLIDVGSGGGLPGLPLAIMRPDVQVTLLEATGKKAKYLEAAAAALELEAVRVVCDRSETAGRQPEHRQRYDLVVARAVGPLNILLELTLPLAAVGGRVLAMKGRQAEAELRDAGDAMMILGAGDVSAYESMPGVEDEATVIEVFKAHPTPAEYPRRPGLPKQQPL